MKVLKSWLNDWIDISEISNEDISEGLESLGFEIEEQSDLKPNYSNIVVGKVLEIYPHPNADKVRVTKTDVGSKTYEIVCGAWNFDVGAVVPVALPNSEIKDGFKIDKRDIRGVESNGMICSASELDLWDDHEGILILDDNILPGTDFSSIYASSDYLWDIGITPNRGDCMSYLGIARELSNYFDKKINIKKSKLNPSITNILNTNSGKIKECDSYGSVEIENLVKDVIYLPEYTTVLSALNILRENKSSFACVIDENGGIEGVITIKDVLSEFVGELPDEHDQRFLGIRRLGPGQWTIEGKTDIDDFEEFFGLEPYDKDIATVGGLFLSHSEQLPSIGEKITLDGLEITVMEIDNRRIDTVVVKKIAKK